MDRLKTFIASGTVKVKLKFWKNNNGFFNLVICKNLKIYLISLEMYVTDKKNGYKYALVKLMILAITNLIN